MHHRKSTDMAAKPMPFFWAWGLPIAGLISLNFTVGRLPLPMIILLMAVTFVWMGLACALNAQRCRRRHCFYSSPIFLLGAMAVLLVGFKIISIGHDGLSTVVWVTLGLALLTYLTEFIQGKYID